MPRATPARKIAARCWAVRARALSRLVSQIYDEAMRPHGLKTSQVNLLVAIGANGEVSPGVLAEQLSLDKSTVSRNADALRRQGWVTSEAAAKGRGRVLRLTEDGASLVRDFEPAWAEAQAELERRLGDELPHLEAMRAALAADAP